MNCLSRINAFTNKLFMQRRYMHKLDVSGIFPAIATPFLRDGKIGFQNLKENVLKWQKVPFKGFLAFGSTGEVVNVSYNERIETVKFLRSLISPQSGKLLLVGTGCESTGETIELTKRVAEIGADAVLVVTPSYYKGKLSTQALESHYNQVADASPIPILLYSVPANTTVDLDPDVVVKLSSHPNIIGMKDSGGDIAKLSYMVHKTEGNEFQILAGSTGFLMPALMTGCVGGIFASANVLGKEACQLFSLVKEGKYDEAKNLQHRLIAPNWAVTKKYGIAGVKYAMDLFGFYGGIPRSPLQALTENEQADLKRIFQESGFLR